MGITRQQALDCFGSDDLIGIGMEADAVRRKLHPEGVVSYIIDRNINYTNFCTEYCTFCAFYRPMGHAEGYVLPKETIYEKIQETIDLGAEPSGPNDEPLPPAAGGDEETFDLGAALPGEEGGQP